VRFPCSNAGANPVSGTVQSQYQTIIEQALETWSAASGLTFKQVASSASPDFQIGWGDFETSTSGLVGYTSHAEVSGGKTQSLLVRLEDPGEDPLVAGVGGSLTYAGTQTTLYQTALHEIGHVLGISETSDPNSVMYPLLGQDNGTLNGTDVKDINALYGPGGMPVGDHATALLIQAMATFGAPASSANLSSLPPPSPTQDHMLAASGLH
jgi:matrixin